MVAHGTTHFWELETKWRSVKNCEDTRHKTSMTLDRSVKKPVRVFETGKSLGWESYVWKPGSAGRWPWNEGYEPHVRPNADCKIIQKNVYLQTLPCWRKKSKSSEGLGVVGWHWLFVALQMFAVSVFVLLCFDLHVCIIYLQMICPLQDM